MRETLSYRLFEGYQIFQRIDIQKRQIYFKTLYRDVEECHHIPLIIKKTYLHVRTLTATHKPSERFMGIIQRVNISAKLRMFQTTRLTYLSVVSALTQ